jgi:hypothetical protein
VGGEGAEEIVKEEAVLGTMNNIELKRQKAKK